MTEALVYIDTLLTLVVPSILITILMTANVYNLIRTYQRQHRLNRKPLAKNLPKSSCPPAARVTKMLFIESLLYVILTIPSHVIRFEILVNSFIIGRTEIPNVKRIMQSVFQWLYYLSFAGNIVVYLKCGVNFRNCFRKTFCSCRCTQGTTRDSREAVNMVALSQTRVRRSLTVIIGAKTTNHLKMLCSNTPTTCCTSNYRSSL